MRTSYRFDIYSTSTLLYWQDYQCAIPVFDSLLPEPHNSAILQLLFVCAHWHSMAKLRMHTDFTLNILDQTTCHLGTECRKFVDKTCAAFDTQELSREVEAHKWCKVKKTRAHLSSAVPSSLPANHMATNGVTTPHSGSSGTTPDRSKDGPRQKKFNLHTYKFHSLGDYANTIRRYGTTNSYSTETVDLYFSLIVDHLRYILL